MTICHITAFLAYNATWKYFCINPNIIPTSYEPIYTVSVVQYLTTGYKIITTEWFRKISIPLTQKTL